MTSEQWTLIKSVFSEAIEIDPHLRDQWLRNRCELPPSVIAEVARLLHSCQTSTTLTPREPTDTCLPQADELVGQTLLDRFHIASLLGSGAMGNVYSAFDRSVGGAVALKTIKPHLTARPEFMASLRREVATAHKVKHENVCQIRDLHLDPNARSGPLLFFTMELLPGRTLASHLSERAFTVQEAMEIARGIAYGLGAVHGQGLIHRDLKPSNVFLVTSPGNSPRAVITDFGLCFDESRSTAETLTAFAADAVVGTPAYMAPEQLLGKGATRKSDIYSFGVLLFEMVTGRPPFTGETSLAVALRRLQESAPEPRSLASHLPARWNSVILSCLQRDPAKRPESVSDLLAALEGTKRLPVSRFTRRSILSGAAATVAGLGGYAVWKREIGRPAVDPRAEYHVAVAREFNRQSTHQSVQNGIAELRQAISIDRRYGAAWADLADAYCLASTYSFMPSPQALQAASSAAKQALSIDDKLGAAHGALAYALSCDLKRWRSAEPSFRRALEVDPKSANARFWYAGFLGRALRFGESVSMAESALNLDPGSTRYSYRLGTELVRARQFQRARTHLEDFVRLHPAQGSGYCLLSRANERLGNYDEAAKALRYAERLPNTDATPSWATLYAATGQLQEAQKVTDLIRLGWLKKDQETNVYLYALGSLYMAGVRGGTVDTIANVMREGITRNDETVLGVASNIYMQSLRNHPTLRPIYEQLGFA